MFEKYDELYMEMVVVGGSGLKEWKGWDVIIGGRKVNYDVFFEYSICWYIKEGMLMELFIGFWGVWIRVRILFWVSLEDFEYNLGSVWIIWFLNYCRWLVFFYNVLEWDI